VPLYFTLDGIEPMSAECQFWLNWAVNALTAVATVGAVVVALFFDRMRARFFPPLLNLQLINPKGVRTTVRLTSPDGSQRDEAGRYYHLRASNGRRWSQASHVQVFLVRVEEPGPDGVLNVTWSGDIPIKWRHQEIFPPARDIGPAADCDLCSVVNGKWVQLHPLIQPFNLNTTKREACLFVVTLQARSTEADSPLIRIQIAWDGAWEDGESEMQRHLTLSVLE
jgi:hypothetical protein